MRLVQDKFGSFVVQPLPSQEVLNKHYRDTYYNGQHTNYPGKYSTEEITFFHFKDKVLDYFLAPLYSDCDLSQQILWLYTLSF